MKRFEWEGDSYAWFVGNRLVMCTNVDARTDEWVPFARSVVREYELDSGEMKTLEQWDGRGVRWINADAEGRWLALARFDDQRVYVRPFWGQEPTVERVVGRHAAPVQAVTLSPRGDRLAAADESGEIRISPLDTKVKEPTRTLRAEGQVFSLRFDPSGTRLAAGHRSDDASNTLVRVWDLETPEGTDPVALRSGGFRQHFPAVAFDPGSRWAVVAYIEHLGFFPVDGRPHVLRGEGSQGGALAFTPDGRSLLAGFTLAGLIRSWSLDGEGRTDLWRAPQQLNGFTVEPEGRHLVATTLAGVFRVSLTDGAVQELPDTPRGGGWLRGAISADGRFAAASRLTPPDQQGIRVWDLESLESRVLEESRGRLVWGLAFAPDGTLFSSDGDGVVSRWDLRGDRRTVVADTGRRASVTSIALSPNGRYLLVISSSMSGDNLSPEARSRSTLYDLDEGTSRPFTSHGDQIVPWAASFDPTSRWIVTGDLDGAVRVGPIAGETPHLLLGHGTTIQSVAVSPDGRWIASSENNEPTVRLWPMPQGPPVQSLPHDQLLARLRAMTNMRVPRDPTSPQGYRLQTEPFPAWESGPER